MMMNRYRNTLKCVRVSQCLRSRLSSSSETSSNSNNSLNIIILGAPGGGKGTICKKLIKDFNFQHISTGDLLRRSVAEGTPVGKAAAAFMREGKLVPDATVVELLREEVVRHAGTSPSSSSPSTSSSSSGSVASAASAVSFLLDGYPRTVEQATALGLPTSPMQRIDLVVSLDVPHEVIMQRMSARWIHAASGRTYSYDYSPPKTLGVDDVTGEALVQREDDKPHVVKARLQGYDAMTAPLVHFYRQRIGEDRVKVFTGEESNVLYPLIKQFVLEHTAASA